MTAEASKKAFAISLKAKAPFGSCEQPKSAVIDKTTALFNRGKDTF